MQCQNCGSTHGFRGEQKLIHRRRADGLMEMVADGSPEVTYCKRCGSEVKPEEVKTVEVISGVPSHLAERFADEMLDGEGASENVSEDERQRLIDAIQKSGG